MGQGSGLAGDLGKLPAALYLSFPIICEIKGWDSTSGFQISWGFVYSSRTLCFQQNYAVVMLLWLKDWQGREPCSPWSPPHPCRAPGVPGALFGPLAWLLCWSPSLASCDSVTRQRWPGSLQPPGPCQARSLPASLLLSQNCNPQHAERLPFPERPTLSCCPVSSHLLFLPPELPFPGLFVDTWCG